MEESRTRTEKGAVRADITRIRREKSPPLFPASRKSAAGEWLESDSSFFFFLFPFRGGVFKAREMGRLPLALPSPPFPLLWFADFLALSLSLSLTLRTWMQGMLLANG